METVTIQCGACGQVIAVSKEHLGQQVQCPLCGAVIEAPAPDQSAATMMPQVRSDEDSIFAPPEEEEDIFGRREEGPKIEMPSDIMVTQAPKPSRAAQNDAPTENLPPPYQGDFANRRAAYDDPGSAPTEALTRTESRSELSSLPPRRYKGSGSFGALVMIFLVPYAIVTTIATAYLLYQRTQAAAIDLMPDNDREDGAPRRVKHDVSLPSRLRTPLNQPIALGDVRITPLKVERTPENDLVLHLKMDNTSTDVAFNPFPDSFHRVLSRQGRTVFPYTYLETEDGAMRLYGGYSARFRTPPGKRSADDDRSFSGVIGPGETLYATLTTPDPNRPTIPRLLASKEPLLWRVHVRRGFFTVGNRDISTTGVIGVEFPTSAIEKG